MKQTITFACCVLAIILHTNCFAQSWEMPLKQALSDCNRISVRSGGTCHRSKKEEKILFAVTQKSDIKQLIESIKIDEARSGFQCMCCGNPTIEFYKGKSLLVMLGYHHGQSLRWSDGKWKGDALLTQESAEHLAKWLSDNGIKEPLKELQENRRQQEAAKRRYDKYFAILPDTLDDELQSAQSAEAFAEAINRAVTNSRKRTILLLKLFGCDYSSWNAQNCLDEFLVEQLNKSNPADLWEAINDVQKEPDGLRGAARWIIVEAKTEDLKNDQLQAVLPSLMRVGLTHPRRINRERTVAFLDKVKSEKAENILRKCLKGDYQIQLLPEDEQIEPGGTITFWPRDKQLSDDCSERAYAAILLARVGDVSAKQLILSLMKDSAEHDRIVYQKALEIIENKMKENSKQDK